MSLTISDHPQAPHQNGVAWPHPAPKGDPGSSEAAPPSLWQPSRDTAAEMQRRSSSKGMSALIEAASLMTNAQLPYASGQAEQGPQEPTHAVTASAHLPTDPAAVADHSQAAGSSKQHQPAALPATSDTQAAMALHDPSQEGATGTAPVQGGTAMPAMPGSEQAIGAASPQACATTGSQADMAARDDSMRAQQGSLPYLPAI